MQRRLPRIIRVRVADETSIITRPSKITFTSVARAGSRNSAGNATEGYFATHAINLSLASLNGANLCHRSRCWLDWLRTSRNGNQF